MGRNQHSTASHSQERQRPLLVSHYADLSKKPLHNLLFLLPLLVLYELGSLIYLTNPDTGAVEKIKAYQILTDLVGTIGISGLYLLYLPGVALLTVLLVAHIATREPWRARGGVIGLMWLESLLFTVPLLVFSQLIARLSAPEAALVQPVTTLADLSLIQRLLISLGAGLYEELLFRMVLIGVVLVLLGDVLNLKSWLANLIAVLLAALLFTAYHQPIVDGEMLWSAIVLYLGSGIYLGCLFLLRGFGIVVAVHALYDIMVLVVLPLLAGS